LSSFRAGDIERDRALAAVGRVIIGGRQVLAIGALDKGRAPAAGVVAALGMLDLDDVGAEIGQQLPGPGTSQDARKLDHTDSGERSIVGPGFTHAGLRWHLAGEGAPHWGL
jgi:hypothetical protein